MLIAIPDASAERNLFALEVPRLGSFIAIGHLGLRARSGSTRSRPRTARRCSFPFFDLPPHGGHGPASCWRFPGSAPGCAWRGRLETTRWFLWAAFAVFSRPASSPCSPGWFTAEVGRQPWVVYGLLRTKDAVTPSLTTADVMFSLLGLYRGLRGDLCVRPVLHLSAAAGRAGGRGERRRCRAGPAAGRRAQSREAGNERDGALRAWRCSGPASSPSRSSSMSSSTASTSASASCSAPPATRRLRDEMMAAISPFWDGNETWLVVIGASLFAAFPVVYAVFLPAFYIPVLLLLFGLIFRGVAFEFRLSAGARGLWDRGFFIGSTVAAFVQGAAVGRDDPRHPGGERSVCRRRLRLAGAAAGAVPASAWCSAMPCSAPAGWC